MSDDSPDRAPRAGADPPDARHPAADAQPLARAALARRKRRDAAVILPLAGALLFASPLLDIFADAGRLFGIPVSVLYIFGCWFALIALTAWLARRLARDGEGG